MPRLLGSLLRLAFLAAPLAGPSAAQTREGSPSGERDEYLAWLATAPVSPLRAVALHPIGRGVRLGPADADVPLPGSAAELRLVERGGVAMLEDGRGGRPLPRGR